MLGPAGTSGLVQVRPINPMKGGRRPERNVMNKFPLPDRTGRRSRNIVSADDKMVAGINRAWRYVNYITNCA